MSPLFKILCSVIGLASGAGVLPDSMNASLRRTVTLTTSLAPTETPFVTIKWSFKGANIITHSASSNDTDPQYKGRITLFISTGSLELRDLVFSDTGDYSVTITPAGGGAPKTGFTTLNVYEPVYNVKITASSTYLMEFNDTVTLSCSASGSGLSFAWFNDSTEVKPSDRVHFSDGGANVTFDPVLRYDQEIYRCNVSNPVSSSRDSIVLSVSYGPNSVILDETEHYLSGSEAYMICQTDSRPRAQYRWFFNEMQLLNNDSVLHLTNLQMNQTGNYSCDAFNSKTLRYMQSNSAPMSVWVGIDNASLTPSSEPVKGSPLNLTCDASGSILTRKWATIYDVEIKPSENIEFFDQKRVMSFKKLTSEDERLYQCEISNPVSRRTSYYSVSFYRPTGLQTAEIAVITTVCIVGVVGVSVGLFFLYRQKK